MNGWINEWICVKASHTILKVAVNKHRSRWWMNATAKCVCRGGSTDAWAAAGVRVPWSDVAPLNLIWHKESATVVSLRRDHTMHSYRHTYFTQINEANHCCSKQWVCLSVSQYLRVMRWRQGRQRRGRAWWICTSPAACIDAPPTSPCCTAFLLLWSVWLLNDCLRNERSIIIKII